MAILQTYSYAPSIRTLKYNLLALRELDETAKNQIIPRIIVRGDNTTDLDAFLESWGDRPFFMEISKFSIDIDCLLNQLLSDPENSYLNKFNFFQQKRAIAGKLIPVIRESNTDNLRNIIQLSIKLIEDFEQVAINLYLQDFEKSKIILDNILNATKDENLNKIILILDYGKIENLNTIESDQLKKCLALIKSFGIKQIVTSSTSFPSNRPNSGTIVNYPCLDPIWQNKFNQHLKSLGFNTIYSDYSATDPTVEAIDFDGPVKPIPYATYLLKDVFEWFTLRDGKGGEYEKFRIIAEKIRQHPNYHGDNFCYSNKEIKNIATNVREKAGNQAFWNKLKINQHISSILYLEKQGYLKNYGLDNSNNYEMDDE